jgi:hypothetical protein
MRLMLALCLLPLPALAEPLTRDAAAAQLFAPDGSQVAVIAGALPDDQARLLATASAGQPYHGAIAISPDEGLMSAATVAAVNHHTVEAAAAQALAECTAKASGAAPCVIAAVIRPAGWAARPLTLSADATRAVDGLRGALAISAATGKFGTGADAQAALAACGVADCAVAIAD